MTRLLFVSLLFLSALAAQISTIKGRVTDPSDAVVPGALVTLRKAGSRELRQSTNEEGVYEFKNVPPGAYTLRVQKPGFALYAAEGLPVSGPSSFDVRLTLAKDAQTLKVEDEQNAVTTDAQQNAGALVLREAELKSLSDDPDQLAQELQALAGPGAGPNGGQIFIDGFTGGRLPPKSSIREIRINQNPYSAEYDRIGFGRIEILTKPGTDKFRGDAFFNFSDESLNSRNPFSNNKPPYQSRLFGGRISGPINKKSSFGLDAEARNVDENAVINATLLDAALQPLRIQQGVVTPQTRYNIGSRLDYALNEKNTLVARYNFSPITNKNQGVGQFTLPSRAFSTKDTDHTLQLTETAILSSSMINETRFQYNHSNTRQIGDNSVAALEVLESFSGGGVQVGNASQVTKRAELQNISTLIKGRHSIKWGGRLRAGSNNDTSPNNFGGTFTFAGGFLNGQQITSLERYRRTLLYQQQGLSPAEIRARGGGATQFSINGGNPLAAIRQTDIGLFLTDDWRIRPNLTFSAGLRWEDQTNISNHNNLAPRIGLTWGVDGGANKAAKSVLRVGAGVFYDRLSENLTLQALRFNGSNQVNYIVQNPDFFPTIPSLSSLGQFKTQQTIRSLYGDIRTPYQMQTSIGIDRQLPRNTTVAVNYVFSRGVHTLRTRNINAPLNGVFPYGPVGNLFQYESTGFARQNQLITNFNTRFSPRVSLFGVYLLGRARSDADGTGSFPADNYNLRNEYSYSAFDVRHRFILGGSAAAKWGISFNPFIIASTGAPFNITTGRDNNLDTQFNDRPAFANGATGSGVVRTSFGDFLTTPGPNDVIIPRNYGRGPGSFTINLRASRTFGFGKTGESGINDGGMPPGMGGGRGPGGGGPPPGMVMGGGRGGPGGGRGGPGGMFGGASTGKRYNLTVSVQARNLLNHVNPAQPTGNLSSPLFGISTQLGGGFGPRPGGGGGGPGGGPGGGGGGAAANRLIELQLRFSF
ncbi:MAG: carboxypeptidase regulatory-like domain-containing protein [Acidobacteriaceae bacterium]|nr:carboxypeptidase regulatory-like domain-containing protein [Acidobacteriaceae bacterium]